MDAGESPPLFIRAARTGDLPALGQIYLDSRRATFTWQDSTTMGLDDFDKSSAGESVLVAELGGVVVAFLAWWPPENFLHSLYVAPGLERRGIGTRLLQAALGQMGRPARLKCLVRNTGALAFYSARGWQTLERGNSEEGEYCLMQLA